MFRIIACLLTLLSYVYGLTYQNVVGEQCSVVYTMGYKYQNWYNLTDVQQTITDDKSAVSLKFYVQGPSDAHILLAAEPSPPPSPGYEIVIGGGANSFCDIRKSRSDDYDTFSSKVIMNTGKILDKYNPVGFWIRASVQSGLIEVGKDGDNLPFMFWTDHSPIPVRYFSFSSWESVVSKWIFKCSSNTTAANTSERMNSGRKFLTYSERLKADVVKKRSALSFAPVTTNAQKILNVMITSDFKFIHLDVMTSTLILRGIATFEWTDNGISWNPSDYKNISKLHLSNYELWKPELILHNALDPATSMFSETKISVNNQGKVTWKPKFDVKTKCDVDLKSWPWDKHKCTVLLSSWSHKVSNIFYEINENHDRECFQVAHSDWKLDKMTSSYVEDKILWDDIMDSINNDNDSKDPKAIALQLVVEISRNTKIFDKLFYIPLILISCLWLSSFCLMPYSSSNKLTTICISLILSTLIIVHMTSYVPVFSEVIPNLMFCYLKLMLMISTDAFVSSFLITAYCRKNTSGHPPFILTRFLTAPVVTTLLVLPKLDQTTNLDYDKFEDHQQEEGQNNVTTLWDIVIVALERVMFAVYFIITVNVLSSV